MPRGVGRLWCAATHEARDERVRLVHAPKGESSGHLTFGFSDMAQPAGRPILAAFEMLLGADALFVGPEEARLPALLAKSREAQAEVSTRLARQVLAALYELLRGFVAADARARGGAPAALMRMVFILYAEDRGLMPDHPVYQQHYSLGGLFARLRADAAAWPDTMDQRFGAWAQRQKSGGESVDIPVKTAEFEVLDKGDPHIGEDDPRSKFHAETPERSAWDPGGDRGLAAIDKLVLVHRLREVVSLLGFTRFEATSPDKDGELDLDVARAALAETVT